jgi:hypothetical protein
MIPDPILDKLARFTPHSTAADQAALLFAAGQASTRTPWGWKVAVVGLMLANLGWLSLLTFQPSAETTPNTPPQPELTPATPPHTELLQPPASNPPPIGDDLWSYRALLSAGDLEQFPRTIPLRDPIQTDAPLTPLAGHRGEFN